MLGHAHLPAPSSDSPTTSIGTEITTDDVVMKSARTFSNPGAVQVAIFGSWKNTSANNSTVPRIHTTLALHLLQWPTICYLVPQPYDPQKLLQLEMAREPLRFDTSLSLDLTNSTKLRSSIFRVCQRLVGLC